jgi:superfamily II DNA helicase RecQ
LVQQTARSALGFELRPEQRDAVDAVVSGRDTLVVMPTGSGKSAIYHVAGLLIDGPTVVVSPLIALQRDQVEMIEEAAAGEALNSARPVREEIAERLSLHDPHVVVHGFDRPNLYLAVEPFNDAAAKRAGCSTRSRLRPSPGSSTSPRARRPKRWRRSSAVAA